MDFYPPLNLDQIFDKTINDFALTKFGFAKSLTKSKSHVKIVAKHSNENFVKSKSLCQSSPIRILRKLGLNERIFHGISDTNRSYIYRTVIINTKINLFKNTPVIFKSIDEWKSMHPLLRCRVFTANDKYFAYASEETIKSNSNVNLYRYQSNHVTSCDDIWKLLVEREMTLPLNGRNGLLWRLTFFHVKTVAKSDMEEFYYAVILTFDHSIMDGRSSYSSLLQLFSLIENNYSKIENKIIEKPLLPAKEDLFKPIFNEKFQIDYYSKRPDFLVASNSDAYIRLKKLTCEEEAKGVVYSHENFPVTTVKELIQISKENNSKFRSLVIQKTDFDRIIQKCKENKVKITMFLNMCLVQAVRLLYEKFDDELNYLIQEPVIHFATNISLREFEEYTNQSKDKNETIGCYISLAFSSYDMPMSYGTRNWEHNFWSLCQNETEMFHSRLKNREFIHSIRLPNKKKNFDEFFYHFGNSNLGILDSSISEKKLIRVKQTFATCKFSKENSLCWFTNLMATIDSQLCWTISFNSCFISQEMIGLLIDNLTQIIKQLIK
ncbi:hypothetical protein BpHYR1_050367 [Brachionus plicatilis]|uniref:Condensation domain-containing protein n=1 Tax=Brachionus plicatilis TaxID=10195 RepID=A0A3M7SUM9_BRAPC|nr:hypothetical protein BpHYR1_050367 [Brachionus plicatilis]